MKPVSVLPVDEIDLSDRDFWVRPEEEREGAFATLRRERPLSYYDEPDTRGLVPPGPETWGASIEAASSRPADGGVNCGGVGSTGAGRGSHEPLPGPGGGPSIRRRGRAVAMYQAVRR